MYILSHLITSLQRPAPLLSMYIAQLLAVLLQQIRKSSVATVLLLFALKTFTQLTVCCTRKWPFLSPPPLLSIASLCRELSNKILFSNPSIFPTKKFVCCRQTIPFLHHEINQWLSFQLQIPICPHIIQPRSLLIELLICNLQSQIERTKFPPPSPSFFS